ncbi:DUF2846 domain-containing protein [Chromobacterium sp. TRC.1.1.SA]|uniref:DUF2846 domain-containing protein n=1 Tax=Chromobacterium indicum TaxID=3110228 RepID=A0ABV0CLQ9_9NEIS
MTTMRILIAAALVAGLSACASTPMASKEADAAAKEFKTPAADAARVYIYRNENFGAAVKLPVAIDNAMAGDTVAHSYIMKDLPAGKHTITGKGENDSSVTLDTVAGKIYYVWQEVKMGLFAPRNQLQEVDEKTGQDGVKESSLIAPL